jgi:hypothetical protein
MKERYRKYNIRAHGYSQRRKIDTFDFSSALFLTVIDSLFTGRFIFLATNGKINYIDGILAIREDSRSAPPNVCWNEILPKFCARLFWACSNAPTFGIKPWSLDYFCIQEPCIRTRRSCQ